MTISSSTTSVSIQGNGSTTVFDYSFLIPYQPDGVTSAEYVVLINDDGDITVLVNGTDYSIMGVGNANGGTVTYPLTGSPLASGNYIQISRAQSYVQPDSYPNYDFLPSTVENGLDWAVGLVQQLANEQPVISPGTVFADLPTPQLAQGTLATITDSPSSTYGATVTVGGGTNTVLVWCNGTEWIVK